MSTRSLHGWATRCRSEANRASCTVTTGWTTPSCTAPTRPALSRLSTGRCPLGDPLSDLGLLLTYWDPISEPVLGLRHVPSANPGFPTADKLAEAYALVSGRDLRDLGFYRALGYVKLAVIAEGIHQRYLAGETVGGGFDTVGSAVPALVSAGHSCLGKTR